MNPIIKVLYDEYRGHLHVLKHVPLHEVIPHDYQALAFIIIALKMLFVLDDKFEM